jgi:hypothetical protein
MREVLGLMTPGFPLQHNIQLDLHVDRDGAFLEIKGGRSVKPTNNLHLASKPRILESLFPRATNILGCCAV